MYIIYFVLDDEVEVIDTGYYYSEILEKWNSFVRYIEKPYPYKIGWIIDKQYPEQEE